MADATVTGPRLADYTDRCGRWSDIQDHLPYLYRETACRDKPVVIELGVRSGFSTSAFLAAAEATGGLVWSADIFAPDVPEDWRKDEHWRFVLGDDLTGRVQACLPPECDVLFIDTSHYWDHTLAELRAYEPRVRPGGVVLCHDTQWAPGDVALPEPIGPVARALTVYCNETGLSWQNRDSAPGWYGLGVIRK